MRNLITTESVLSAHPDKMCDVIADKLLDAYLKGDKNSRVAIEVMATSKKVIIGGEVTSSCKVDIKKIVRDTIINLGYDNDELGFNGHSVKIQILINHQSQDISNGVNKTRIGAGDQGMMFGYATKETIEMMPLPCVLVNKLARELQEARTSNRIPYLLPDGKCQITYDKDRKKIDTIVLSCQHKEIDLDTLRNDIKEKVIFSAIDKKYLDKKTRYLINPTGCFKIGGPVADTGLTGRKIIVDTYGGIVPHGGGAFSGKDCTKVDRTGAYYARYVAKNIVASGLCDKLLITVSYAIGISEPVSIYVNIFEDNQDKLAEVKDVIDKFFDFSVGNMIRELSLDEPIYAQTTSFSHFGRSNLPYEKTNKARYIHKYLNGFNYNELDLFNIKYPTSEQKKLALLKIPNYMIKKYISLSYTSSGKIFFCGYQKENLETFWRIQRRKEKLQNIGDIEKVKKLCNKQDIIIKKMNNIEFSLLLEEDFPSTYKKYIGELRN